MVILNTSGLFAAVWRLFVWKYLWMLLPECNIIDVDEDPGPELSPRSSGLDSLLLPLQAAAPCAGTLDGTPEARVNTERSFDLPENLGFSTDISPFRCQLS